MGSGYGAKTNFKLNWLKQLEESFANSQNYYMFWEGRNIYCVQRADEEFG
jgi:hypothetical protein